MSSLHLTFLPPVASDPFIVAAYATGSHAESGGHAGGRAVVTPMWGEHLSICLFARLLWMIDSGLQMMASHNHLPSAALPRLPIHILFVYLLRSIKRT